MNKYCDIALALINEDLSFVESLVGLLKHQTELKTTFQTNYIELKEGKTNEFFFKLYILNNNRWDFFDYGWLKIVDNHADFCTYKSKLLIFKISQIQITIRRHADSLTHIVTITNGTSYLLFNPHPEVLNILFRQV